MSNKLSAKSDEEVVYEKGDCTDFERVLKTALYRVGNDHDYNPGSPWSSNYDLHFSGQGGHRNYELTRFRVVTGSYVSSINRTLEMNIKRDFKIKARRDAVYNLQYPQPDGFLPGQSSFDSEKSGLHIPHKLEKLTVGGRTEIWAHTRTIILSGKVKRLYKGGLLRNAPLEGSMTGGAYAKLISGASTTISGIASGDYYLGNMKTHATSLYGGALGYRSYDMVARNDLNLNKFVSTYLLPPATVPAESMQDANNKGKWAAKLAIGVTPFTDLVFGLFGAIVGLIKLAGVLLKALGVKLGLLQAKTPPKPKPPAPRTWTINCGGKMGVYGVQTVT